MTHASRSDAAPAGEAAQRAAVVAEALSWIGTPYHHEARLKGVGVDCAQLLVGVFSAPGVALIPPIEIAHYPHDWHLHRAAERYLAQVLEHAGEIPGPPLPGDVVLWRIGRCYSHGAIVIRWPVVVHAYVDAPCASENVEHAAWLGTIGEAQDADKGKPRPRKFFSYWARPR